MSFCIDYITCRGSVPEGNNSCCVKENSNGCIQLPDNLENLLVIWPRAPKSVLDCVCPVQLRSTNGAFEDCYCIRDKLTVYNVTLTNKQLCWNNLTRVTNNTKIFFVRDVQDSIDPYKRIFQSETRLVVEG